MKHFTCKDVEPLLPATAAGALDADDETPVHEHLATCHPCLKYLHDYQETVVHLAYTAPQMDPPPYLRQKVLQAITITTYTASAYRAAGPLPDPPPALTPSKGSAARARAGRAPGRWFALYRQAAPALLAVCLILLAGTTISMALMAGQLDALTLRVEREHRIYTMLTAPGSKLAAFKSSAQGSKAIGQAIMAPGIKQVAIMATHLPQPPSGRGYYLWMLYRGAPMPQPGAWLPVDGAGVMMAVAEIPIDPEQADGLRITDETLGGTPTPTGTNWLEGWYH